MSASAGVGLESSNDGNRPSTSYSQTQSAPRKVPFYKRFWPNKRIDVVYREVPKTNGEPSSSDGSRASGAFVSGANLTLEDLAM